MSNLCVVILAAGKGKRMRSSLPKVLHAVGGRPMLAHVVDTAAALGATQTVVVYGHGGDQVRAALPGGHIGWVEQREQLGTGHAVMQAADSINDDATVLVLYGDVPLTRESTLRRLLAGVDAQRMALLTVDLPQPDGYGRIVRDAAGQVQAIVEHKDASAEQLQIREVNTGILAAKGAALKTWLARLGNDNAQGEYYLTDIIGMAVADGLAINVSQPDDADEVMGVNNRVQLAVLERACQRRMADALMTNGATLLDPARVDVRGTLSTGEDVLIDINAVFEGEVSLGNKVSIGPNCTIRNASIGDDTTIFANSVIENAVIGDACRVGPFARVRPDTVIADKVHLGNFVEVKKSTIANGSKVNHLSYIGDAEVGSGVNVGAGTITCNYDGANKHKTIIGDNAFIGSDTQLVAPVTVGDGATIGAGSTITHNTPPGELTLSRSKQVSRAGWKRPLKKPKA